MRLRLSVISGLALLSVAVLRLSLAALGALPVPAPQPEPHGWPDSLAERENEVDAEPHLSGSSAALRTVPAEAQPVTRGTDVQAGPTAETPMSSLRVELATREMPEFMWKDLYSLYEQHGQLRSFRRKYDALPARPLGVLPTEYLSWLGTRDPVQPIVAEPANSVASRMSRLNRSYPHKLLNRSFQLVGYDYGDYLQSTVGDGTICFGLDAIGEAKYLAATHDQVFQELAPGEQQELVRIVQEWQAGYEELRADLWSVLETEAERRSVLHAHEAGVVAVLAMDFRLCVIRRGDSPELERLIQELADLERRVRVNVEALYR